MALLSSGASVEQAAFASYLPTGDSGRTAFDVVGMGREGSGNLFSVSPGAFDVLGIPIERGRDFNTSDLASSRGVAIISSSLAASAWPDQGPIGRHILAEAVSAEPLEVIGVVGDVRSRLTNRTTPTRQLWRLGKSTAMITDGLGARTVLWSGGHQSRAAK